MNYINILLAKINYFNSKMADSNYSDIRSLYHSNCSSTKYHIRFSPNLMSHELQELIICDWILENDFKPHISIQLDITMPHEQHGVFLGNK